MSTRKEKAVELFNQKHNCAQSVFLSYCDLFNIDQETALKLTSGFGMGMAGLGETCGAINASAMLIGLKYGDAGANKIIRNFIKDFNENHESFHCRNLVAEPQPEIRGGSCRKCTNIVEEICDLLEKYLGEEDG